MGFSKRHDDLIVFNQQKCWFNRFSQLESSMFCPAAKAQPPFSSGISQPHFSLSEGILGEMIVGLRDDISLLQKASEKVKLDPAKTKAEYSLRRSLEQ